jgi:ligand-binding sensor domain-containing protein
MYKKWALLIVCIVLTTSMVGCKNTSLPILSSNTLTSSPAKTEAGWTLFPNGNQINVLITKGNEVWAATTGGVERWDQTTGTCRLYTIMNGLPDNKISSIAEDNQGNIWAATNDKISFYDGTGWTTVNQGFPNISRILSDQSGNLWVFTFTQGLMLFDGHSWQNFSTIEGLSTSGNIGNAAVIDQKGNLWLSLDGQGIGYYNGQSWRVFNTADGLANNMVYAVFVDDQDNLWCSTVQGVSRYNGTTWQNFDGKENGFESIATNISQDDHGNIWFWINDSTYHVLHRYDGQTWQEFTTEGLTDPQFLAVDHEGNLWGANLNGLRRFDGKSWQTFSKADGFYGVSIPLHMDQNGNLWFGTKSGIKHYDGKAWQTLTTPAGPGGGGRNDFMDKDGNLWLGPGDGVSCYNGKTWKTFTEIDGLSWGYIMSPFFQDSQGNIWCATESGIDRYDGKSWHKFDENDGIDMAYFFGISSIAQDKKGDIWFGTQYSKPIAALVPGETYPPDINKQPEGGIYRYDGKSWRKFTTQDGPVSNNVRAIVKDNKGNLWFGTDKGVSRYDGTNWKTFTQTDGIASNGIQSIFKDKTGNLWFVTDDGLSRFDGTSWKSFSFEGTDTIGRQLVEDGNSILCFGVNLIFRFDGLSSQPITVEDNQPGISFYSMAISQDGSLWLGTNQGLVQYDGKTWRTFTIMDGLEFNSIPAILIDRNGKIWCETAYGLARYTPIHQ